MYNVYGWLMTQILIVEYNKVGQLGLMKSICEAINNIIEYRI